MTEVKQQKICIQFCLTLGKFTETYGMRKKPLVMMLRVEHKSLNGVRF
jgi:hypothetical protein